MSSAAPKFRSPPLTDRYISLAHGNGGRMMRELIETVFAPALHNRWLDTGADAVGLPGVRGDELVVTTDGFTVQPLEFPGGDIGSLAVHGTVNDLAVAGAVPRYLTLNVFLEEGLEVETLRRLAASIGRAARDCKVDVVAGDTKVVGRGECDGVYLATTGIGFRNPRLKLGFSEIEPGDRLIISGPVGEHGTAVMLARESFGLRGDLRSDAASVLREARALTAVPGLRFMRDPTRGGLATVAHEIARATGFGIRLDESAIPVRDPVQSVCELLGFDPLYLACEGRILAVVAATATENALKAVRRYAPGAAVIGEVVDAARDVVLATSFGGERVLDELEDDPLPRIC
jgi:hydrogenase expression/formation protein HypE